MTAIARPATFRDPPRWQSWGLIGGLLLVMTVSHGIISAGLPALDSAILEDLRITRGALKLRETIFLLSSGCSGLLIGFLTTRVQPARIVHLGLLLLAVTLFGYSHATSIGQIYLLYVLLGLCFASSHVVIVVLMVRTWFATRRTLAISIALSGTSIGAAIFPNVTVAALEGLDWREVVRWAAILPLLVLPAALILVRGGRAADGDEEGTPGPTSVRHVRRRHPLALALLMMATFGTFFASTAFLLNLFLYLQDIGMDARSAALGLSVVFITGLIGKVLVGMAAEKWGTNRVWNSQQLILLAGALVLSMATPAFAFVGLLLLGAGWAGCYVLTQVVIADYFAGPRLGQYTGAFIVFEAIASGTGVWAAGATFDVFGSYRPGFYVCTALIAIAVVCGYLFRRVTNVPATADQEPLA